MFTGIIEKTGVIKGVTTLGTNKTFLIESDISGELSIDQSVAHNGVCLTVEKINGNIHQLTAVEETLIKTNLNDWNAGSIVNLERCLVMNGRLDGHIVQGHVDTTATCISIADKKGSWEFIFEFDKKFAHYIIEKGSITLNGISLTIFNVTDNTFTVAIIPYTFEHTNMKYLKEKDLVNIEFDMIGKYVVRSLTLKDK
ncbi:MAG: riboflavin synthase [Bacteroidota bacterium]